MVVSSGDWANGSLSMFKRYLLRTCLKKHVGPTSGSY